MPAPKLPVIGHENLLESGTVTTDGSDAANAYDWLMHDKWTSQAAATSYIHVDMTSATACDYWAIAGHDIDEQTGSVVLQWSDNNADWFNATAAVTPSDGSPILRTFSSISHRYWRLYLTGLDAAAYIAVVSFGARLDLPRGPQKGFGLPTYSRKDKMLVSKTHNGNLLGVSLIRTGITGSLALKSLPEGWYAANFDPFILHARTSAWFLAWDSYGHADDVALCFPLMPTPMPTMQRRGWLDVTLKYEGIAE